MGENRNKQRKSYFQVTFSTAGSVSIVLERNTSLRV